jgi:hypothetical protein
LFKKNLKTFFQKKKKKTKEKKNLGCLRPPPLGTKGWLGHPYGAKGVAETTPNGGLGVISATPSEYWFPITDYVLK